MAKKSYLSATARTTMQNTTFPGHSGKADLAGYSHQMVRDGLWTGRPDNSNHTKRVVILNADTPRHTPKRTARDLGIVAPKFGGKRK